MQSENLSTATKLWSSLRLAPITLLHFSVVEHSVEFNGCQLAIMQSSFPCGRLGTMTPRHSAHVWMRWCYCVVPCNVILGATQWDDTERDLEQAYRSSDMLCSCNYTDFRMTNFVVTYFLHDPLIVFVRHVQSVIKLRLCMLIFLENMHQVMSCNQNKNVEC